jgi:hypothetical protein
VEKGQKCGNFFNFENTAQIKLPANEHQFSQSGHPVYDINEQKFSSNPYLVLLLSIYWPFLLKPNILVRIIGKNGFLGIWMADLDKFVSIVGLIFQLVATLV